MGGTLELSNVNSQVVGGKEPPPPGEKNNGGLGRGSFSAEVSAAARVSDSMCRQLGALRSDYKRLKDTRDKCPAECLTLGCHGDQGRVLFKPADTQRLPPVA